MKRFLSYLFTLACLLAMAPGAAYAADNAYSLTIKMEYDNAPLSGLNVSVCQVAAVREQNGARAYVATPAFAGAGADFTNLTKERNIALAAALHAYAAARNIPRVTKTTDSGGSVTFTGLAPGLYLVAQAGGEDSEYRFAPYLVSVQGDTVAYPKTEPVPNDKYTCVSVYKVWAGKITTLPNGILVQLLRDGVPYGSSVRLDASNNWSYTWDHLDVGHTWTVDEFDVPEGYVKTIAGSAGTGYVITNTRRPDTPEKIRITGKKTWVHGNNPAGQRPTSILVRVYADGKLILQREIGEAQGWSWSFLLDKYDQNGREIVYTVDEAPVKDYTKTVDGYNITNTYKDVPQKPKKPHKPNKPSKPSKPGNPGNPGRPWNPGRPKTDDMNQLGLWLAVMGLSAAGLATAAVFLARRRRRREKTTS